LRVQGGGGRCGRPGRGQGREWVAEGGSEGLEVTEQPSQASTLGPRRRMGEGGERGRGPSGIVTSVLARDTDAARPAIVTSGPVDTGDLIQCSTVTRAVRALYGSLQDTLCCRRRVAAH
jgi:hypothetical protein